MSNKLPGGDLAAACAASCGAAHAGEQQSGVAGQARLRRLEEKGAWLSSMEQQWRSVKWPSLGALLRWGKKREQKVACEGSHILNTSAITCACALAAAALQLQHIERHSSAAEAAAHASD
jgi:hypothetical protein